MFNNKQISLGIGFSVALVFVLSIPGGWANLEGVKQRQTAANDMLIEWKASYEALLPVNDRFIKTYPAGYEAKDLVALYRLLDVEKHGLMADVDLIRQLDASAVEVNGVPIGLQRLCVGNSAESLTLTASSIGSLRTGVRALSGRKDLDIGTIEFAYIDGQPVAKLRGVCLKVRTETSPAIGQGV